MEEQNTVMSRLATKKNMLIGAGVLGVAIVIGGIVYMTGSKSQNAAGASASDEATISFDGQGNTYWNGEKISKEELDARVAASQK